MSRSLSVSATDAAAYEGRRLRQGLLDSSNTASGVWADTADRSAGRRDVPEQEWLRQPHPSQEAERPRYARDDAAGQQCEIENPLACRACVRRAKGSDRMELNLAPAKPRFDKRAYQREYMRKQLVLIVGEPGLGKSRLIEEFHAPSPRPMLPPHRSATAR